MLLNIKQKKKTIKNKNVIFLWMFFVNWEINASETRKICLDNKKSFTIFARWQLLPEIHHRLSDETLPFWGYFEWLSCLSHTGVLSLVALDGCLWFWGTAMDKNHLYADSVVHFVVFEAGDFLFLLLPKMLLTALFEIGELFQGRMSSFWVPYAVLWKEPLCSSAVTYVRLKRIAIISFVLPS